MHILTYAHSNRCSFYCSIQIAVHCHAGYGRTGLVIASILVMTKNMTAQQAVALVREKRPTSVQTSAQVNGSAFVVFCLPQTTFLSLFYFGRGGKVKPPHDAKSNNGRRGQIRQLPRQARVSASSFFPNHPFYNRVSGGDRGRVCKLCAGGSSGVSLHGPCEGYAGAASCAAGHAVLPTFLAKL